MSKFVVEKFTTMLGKTLSSIDGKVNEEQLDFISSDGTIFRFKYYQDCCATCYIVDIIGDLEDLLNSPILEAEQITSENYKNELTDDKKNAYDSYTWSFYRFSTVQGTVTVRWLGESNGYYSETVNFEIIKPKKVKLIKPEVKKVICKHA